MTLLRTVIIVTTLSVAHHSLVAQPAGEILVVEGYLGDGPWARSAGRWLALMNEDGGFVLGEREVRVYSRPIDPSCGGVEYLLQAGDENPGTLLLRGFPMLKAGPIVTAFLGTPGAGRPGKFLLPGEGLDISLGGDNHWGLTALGTVRSGGGGLGELSITDYQVHMTGSRRTGAVFSLPRVSNDRPPHILWAGDLDRDRVPDVFADVAPHYNAHRYVLFLSSRAGAGQIVAEAASLAFVGC